MIICVIIKLLLYIRFLAGPEVFSKPIMEVIMNVSIFLGNLSNAATQQAIDSKLDATIDRVEESKGKAASAFHSFKAGALNVVGKVLKKIPENEHVTRVIRAIDRDRLDSKIEVHNSEVASAKSRIKKRFHSQKARLAFKIAILARAASLAATTEVKGELFIPISKVVIESAVGIGSVILDGTPNLGIDTQGFEVSGTPMSLEDFVTISTSPRSLSTPKESVNRYLISKAQEQCQSKVSNLIFGEDGSQLINDIHLVAKDALSKAYTSGKESACSLLSRVMSPTYADSPKNDGF